MVASRSRSVLIVTIGSALQLLVQLALQLVLAREFGAGSDMDAYVAAATVPMVLASMISIPLGAVLIPSLSRIAAREDAPAAMRFAGQVGIAFAGTTFLAAGLLAWLALPVCELLFPGLTDADQALTSRLLRSLAWLVPANTLTMYCQSVQNWQGRFALPALAGVLGPALTIAIVIAMAPGWGIEAVAWGVIAGAAINVLAQWPGLRGVRWQIPSMQNLSGLLAMMGPLVLASMYVRLEPLIDRSLASTLDVGVISQLGYTSRIVNAILALTSGVLSVVAFPFLASAAAKGHEELAEEVARTLEMLAFFVLPFVGAFLVFAPQIVRDLFERGEFTSADTAAVALLIRTSLGVVVGASVGEICARAFYSDHSVWSPVIVGAITLSLAIVAKVLLTPRYGAVALTGSSSVAYLVSASVLVGWLYRRLGAGIFADVPGALLTSGGCTLLACLVGWLVMQLPLPLPAVCGGIAGGVIFCLAAVLIPGRVSHRVLEILRSRLGRNGDDAHGD